MNDIESNLMWKAYADRGYAIRTTWERLAIAFDGVGDDVQPVVLDYIDFEISEIEIGNIFTAIIKKDIAYQDEREFRLMFWQPKHLDFHHPPPPGIKVPIDVGKLIDRIYVSPSVRGIPTDLEALLASHGLLNSVYRSSVKERF
jgi:hypothetical protein